MRKALKRDRGIEKAKKDLEESIQSGLRAQKNDQEIRRRRAAQKAQEEAERRDAETDALRARMLEKAAADAIVEERLADVYRVG